MNAQLRAISELDRVIHEPGRLMIAALLWAVDSRRWVWVSVFTAIELVAGHPETAIVSAFIVGVWLLSQRPSLRSCAYLSYSNGYGLHRLQAR